MALGRDDYNKFKEVHDIEAQRKELEKKYLKETFSDWRLSQDEKVDIYHAKFSKLNNKQYERNIYHAAYYGANEMHNNAINLNDKVHKQSLADWLAFFRTNDLTKVHDVYTAIYILRKKEKENEIKKNQYGVFEKVIDISLGNMPGGKIVAKLSKTGGIVWSFLKDHAHSTLVPDSKGYYEQFVSKWGAKPENLLKLLEQPEVSLSPEANKIFISAILKNIINKDASAEKTATKMIDTISANLENILKKDSANLKKEVMDILRDIKAESSNVALLDILMERVGKIESDTASAVKVVQEFQDREKYLSKLSSFEYQQDEIAGLQKGFNFLADIAKFTKSPELMKFAVVGQHFSNLLNSISQLKRASDLYSMGMQGGMALAGGYAGVGIAVLGLASSFMNQGPSAEEVILDYMQKLGNFIDKQFQQVHQELSVIHKDMVASFAHLEKICRANLEAINNLGERVTSEIIDFKIPINRQLDSIENKVNTLIHITQSGHREVVLKDFYSALLTFDENIRLQNFNNESMHNALRELVNTHILTLSRNDLLTGAYLFENRLFEKTSPVTRGAVYSPYTSVNKSFITHPKKYEQSLRLLEVLNSVDGDYGHVLGFLIRYAQSVLQDEMFSIDEIQSLINHYKVEVNQKNNDIKSLEAEIGLQNSNKLSQDEADILQGKKNEVAYLKSKIHELSSMVEDLNSKKLEKLNKIKESVHKKEDYENKSKLFNEQKSELESELSVKIKSAEVVNKNINFLTPAWKILYRLAGFFSHKLPVLDVYINFYTNYIVKSTGNNYLGEWFDEEAFNNEILVDRKIFINLSKLRFDSDVIPIQKATNHVLMVTSSGDYTRRLINQGSRKNISYPRIISDTNNDTHYIDPFVMSVTGTQMENLQGSLANISLFKKLGRITKVLLVFDVSDLSNKALAFENLLDICLNAFEKSKFSEVLPSVIWAPISQKLFPKKEILQAVDNVRNRIADRFKKSNDVLDEKKLRLLRTFSADRVVFGLQSLAGDSELTNLLSNDYGNVLSHDHFNFFGDQQVGSSIAYVLNSIYRSANKYIFESVVLSKEIQDLSSKIDVVKHNIIDADHDMHHDHKGLSSEHNNLIFNNDIWTIGVRKYLELLKQDSVREYSDQYFNINQIIMLGENQLNFINYLRKSKVFFGRLWSGYAESLLYINYYYNEEYKKFINEIPADRKKHDSFENPINSSLIRPYEEEFVGRLLNKDTAIGAKILKYLTILDSQKRILSAFYYLCSNDREIFALIDSLLDKRQFENSLHELINFKKPVLIATEKVYVILNENFQKLNEKYTQEVAGSAFSRSNLAQSISSILLSLYKQKNIFKMNPYISLYAENIDLSEKLNVQENSRLLPLINIPKDFLNKPQTHQLEKKENIMKTRMTFEELIVLALEKANMQDSENAVIVIGATGAGKSSLIDSLAGCEMEYTQHPDQPFVRVIKIKSCPDNFNPAVIDHSTKSGTLFPAGYAGNQSIIYIDFPGFDDTRGEDVVTLNMLATQVAVKTIKSIKAILVAVSYGDLEQTKLLNLTKIFKTMSTLFKDPNKHQNSLRLVVTHLPEDKKINKADVVARLTTFYRDVDQLLQAENTRENRDLELFLSLFIKNTQNIFLHDPISSRSRQALERNILKSEAFPSSEMNLVGGEASKIDFIAKITNFLNEGNAASSAICTLPNEIELLIKNKSDLMEQKKSLHADMDLIRKGISDVSIIDEHLVQMNELILRKVQEINVLENKKHSVQDKIKKANDEIKSIEQRKDLVVYDAISWDEQKTFSNVKRGVVHEKLLQWSGPSFTKVDNKMAISSCKAGGSSGYFDSASEKSDPVGGKYEIKYIGPKNCYGKAEINILMEYRVQPHIKARLVTLHSELSSLNNELANISAELVSANQAKIEIEKSLAESKKALIEGNIDNSKLMLEAKLKAVDVIESDIEKIQHKVADHTSVLKHHLTVFNDNKSLYETLIKLHKAIDFPSEEYKSFSKDYQKTLEAFDSINLSLYNVTKTNIRQKSNTLIEEFHRACTECVVDKVNAMARDNEVLHQPDSQNKYPLDLAVTSSCEENKMEIIKILLLAGASSCSDSTASLLVKDISHKLYQLFPHDMDALKYAIDKISILNAGATVEPEDSTCDDEEECHDEMVHSNGGEGTGERWPGVQVIGDHHKGMSGARYTWGYQLADKVSQLKTNLISGWNYLSDGLAYAYKATGALFENNAPVAVRETAQQQAQPSYNCHPAIFTRVPAGLGGNAEYDQVLTCEGKDYKVYVTPKGSNGSGVSTYVAESGACYNQDTYDLGTCRTVEFYGQQAVMCEGTQTNMFYTRPVAPNPLAVFDDQLALGAVTIHLLKKLFGGKDKGERIDSNVKQNLASKEEVGLCIQALDSKLNSIKQQAAEQKTLAWIDFAYEALQNNVATLRKKLAKNASISVTELDEVRAGLQVLEDEINEEEMSRTTAALHRTKIASDEEVRLCIRELDKNLNSIKRQVIDVKSLEWTDVAYVASKGSVNKLREKLAEKVTIYVAELDTARALVQTLDSEIKNFDKTKTFSSVFRPDNSSVSSAGFFSRNANLESARLISTPSHANSSNLLAYRR